MQDMARMPCHSDSWLWVSDDPVARQIHVELQPPDLNLVILKEVGALLVGRVLRFSSDYQKRNWVATRRVCLPPEIEIKYPASEMIMLRVIKMSYH